MSLRGAVLRIARDLRPLPPLRSVLPPPASFRGGLDEFAERYVLPNLPSREAVEDFHKMLSSYLASEDPLHLVRMVKGMERGHEYRTTAGVRLRATDNAPAWWVHFALLQECRMAPNAMEEIMATIPSHLFEVAAAAPTTANRHGWHFAHILNAKDRDTDYHAWSREEASKRCVRSLHPCNYFLVPLPGWQRTGGDPEVISYFTWLFANRYSSVWSEFRELAAADGREPQVPAIPPRFELEPAADSKPSPRLEPAVPHKRHVATPGDPTYSASRLAFKRDVIEPLAEHESFTVVTPMGTFVLTKAEFCSEFPNVRASASYRESGYYNFPKLPRKAGRFRVDPGDTRT